MAGSWFTRVAGRLLSVSAVLAVCLGVSFAAHAAPSGGPTPIGRQTQVSPAADRAAGFQPAPSRDASGAGPCPNATSYAFDPRTDRCIALPPCPDGLIFNPDKQKCVPRPPGGVLECLDSYVFDARQNACVAPGCGGGMVFSAQQGRCAPAPPVPCPPGFMASARGCDITILYKALQFVIVTGADDLRGNSYAWAIIDDPNGSRFYCPLHSGGDAWTAGSTHTVPCDLTGHEMTFAMLQDTKVTIAYHGLAQGLTYDTGDNWNLQSVTIDALNEGQRPICAFQAAGDPLHRFQILNGRNLTQYDDTVDFDAASGSANDEVVITDLTGGCPP